jgi:hypothetical protein
VDYDYQNISLYYYWCDTYYTSMQIKIHIILNILKKIQSQLNKVLFYEYKIKENISLNIHCNQINHEVQCLIFLWYFKAEKHFKNGKK